MSVFFSSRRRHTRYWRDWSSDVCSSDLSQRRRGTRVGTGIGAVVGWLTFFTLAWLTEILRPAPAQPGLAAYAFPPLALAAAGLVLYALFTMGASFERRRNLVLAGAAVALAAGLVVLATRSEERRVGKECRSR